MTEYSTTLLNALDDPEAVKAIENFVGLMRLFGVGWRQWRFLMVRPGE